MYSGTIGGGIHHDLGIAKIKKKKASRLRKNNKKLAEEKYPFTTSVLLWALEWRMK